MAKTLTLRLDDGDAEELERVIHHCQTATASKTIMKLIWGFREKARINDIQLATIYKLEHELAAKAYLIDSAREACARLLDHTGQSDLLLSEKD